MISIVLMLKRKQGLTKEQFRQHYETTHVPLIVEYGSHLFRDYKRNYVQSSNLPSGWGEKDNWDVVTILTFADQAALDQFLRIVNQPSVKAALQGDDDHFVDRSATLMNLCEEV